MCCGKRLQEQEMSKPERYVGTGAAGMRMGFSPETIRGLCVANMLKGAYQDDNNEWRIPERSVERWMCRNQPNTRIEKLRGYWYDVQEHPRLSVPFIVLGVLIALLSPLSNVLDVFSFVEERTRPLPIMTGDRNVAVTPFQVIGRSDNVEWAPEMAINIANAIEAELNQVGEELGQTFRVRPPSDLKVIAGNTEERRAKNAQALAEEIRAHVVIYGVIELEGREATLRPEFYVYDGEFGEAAEITGHYRMADPIPIKNIASVANRRDVTRQIEERMRGLAYVMYGVSEYLAGRYPDAAARFNQALTVDEPRGHEVVNVLLGNALLKQQQYHEAEQLFRAAIEVNPNYSRAYVGLGSALLRRAAGDVNTDDYDTVNLELLDEATSFYQQATDQQLEQPPLAFVPAKATLAIGQALLLKAQVLNDDGLVSESVAARSLAGNAFSDVITEYSESQDERVLELVADAHAHLGLIYWLDARPQDAIQEYGKAIGILPMRDRNMRKRAQYETGVGSIYLDLEQLQDAAVWYKRALDILLAE